MSELSEWIFGGSIAAIFVAGLGAIGLVLVAERRQAQRVEWAAAHPHEQVEPPTVPTEYQFINRDGLAQLDRDVLDQIHTREWEQPPASDHEPTIGDVVLTFVDVDVDGERVHAWVAARVVWPRETYVRAQVFARHEALGERVIDRSQVDIPREAIASVLHLTGLPPTEPAPAAAPGTS